MSQITTETRPFEQTTARLRVVPAKHPWSVFGTILAIVLIGFTLKSVLLNPRWGWGVVAEYFFYEPVLRGLARTLLLTTLAAAFGFLLGGVLAASRVSKSLLLSRLAWLYIWLLRSVPLVVLLIVLNNLGFIYPTIDVGIPFTDISFAHFRTTSLLDVFPVAVIGLSLNQAAFAAEIIRGGILSVDAGQHEAAAALGLSRWRQATRIILPQAMRFIVPPAFNELIGLAKATSIVYVLALPELFYTVQVIYRRNLEVIPLLMVATIWYLVILTVLSVFQFFIERHFSRGERGSTVRISGGTSAMTNGPILASENGNATAKGQHKFPPLVDPKTAGHIDIANVSKRFGAFFALDNVSLTVGPGEVVAIVGPSGAGKSTLLRTINHLERASEGVIAVDGDVVGYERRGDRLYELKEAAIRKRRAKIGMVFQNFNLFPHMTVLENIIEAPISVQGMRRSEAVAIAQDLLARVGLSDKADAFPRRLSGGQQQRVAICRAVALRPNVILFDEPTSALDPELVGEVLDAIKELASTGTTMVIVTHEMAFAREVATKIVFMERGRIVEVGTPEQIFRAPLHARTAEFVASIL